MNTFNDNFDFTFDDLVNVDDGGFEAPSSSQRQGQEGQVLARQPSSSSSDENQGRDNAASSQAPTEGGLENVTLAAAEEEREIVGLTWEEFTQGVLFAADDDSEGDVLAGVAAPPSESQEAWGRSQGMEEDVSGNAAQAVPSGLDPLLEYHQGYAQSHEQEQQQQLSGIGAHFEPFDVASPPVHQQAYPQSQQHVSGNGAQIAPPRLAPPAAGFGEWGQREGYVLAASMVGTAHVGVQQANLAQPFSAARARSAPGRVAPQPASHVAWDPREDAPRVDLGGNAVHLGGQQANLAPPLSANPAQATLASRPHQNLPPAYQYGGQVAMVPGVPLAPALAPAPAPVPASAPGPASPVLNPYLPPAPAAPRRTGRGKGNPYGPQNFPCGQCDFATGTKQKLVSHERIHTNPSHFCTVNGCGKTFWSAKDLKRHVDTHFPERAQKYVCGECGKEDKRRDNHLRHVDSCRKRKRKREDEGRDRDEAE